MYHFDVRNGGFLKKFNVFVENRMFFFHKSKSELIDDFDFKTDVFFTKIQCFQLTNECFNQKTKQILIFFNFQPKSSSSFQTSPQNQL